MIDLWSQCQGEQQITAIQGEMYRLVESQEQIATRGYVDSLEEQAVLEDLLEQSKPRLNDPQSGTLHYLLKTPFRYPPLRWGSRFGRTHEPSLFYAGKDIEVTLAESAYYRLIFLYSMQGPAPAEQLCTEHSLFSVGYQSQKALQLQRAPFDQHQQLLRHPRDYTATQQLGSAMRAAGVEAFEFASARASSNQAICVALYTPACFSLSHPTSIEPWFCELTPDQVTFKAHYSNTLYRFSYEQFCIDGYLPLPA